MLTVILLNILVLTCNLLYLPWVKNPLIIYIYAGSHLKNIDKRILITITYNLGCVKIRSEHFIIQHIKGFVILFIIRFHHYIIFGALLPFLQSIGLLLSGLSCQQFGK